MSKFNPLWWSKPPVILSYGVAVLSAIAALIIAWWMEFVWHSAAHASLFLCAVMFSAWFGGIKPALLAIVLSVLAFDYYFLAMEIEQLPRLLIFALLALFVMSLSAAQRSAAESFRHARDDLQETFQELKRINEALQVENIERKRAEAALRHSDAYLGEAQRLSHTGSFGWRVSTGELLWSEESFRIFQYDRTTKPTVARVLQRVHPEDAALVKQTIERASQEGKDLDFAHRLLMPDGSVKYVHVVAHALSDASGSIEFVGAVMDVTVAQEAEDRIRLIINTVPALIWTARPDGGLDFISQRWLDYAGMTLEQKLGRDWGAQCHPDDIEQLRSQWRAAVAEGKPFETETRVRRFDGAYRWFLSRAFPLFDRSGQILGWYGNDIDIHDRKQAEEKLREQANLLNLTHDSIVVRDMHNVITYWNRGAEEFYGWTAEEAVGKVTTHQLLQTVFPAPIDEIDAELLRTGRWEGELVHTKADGTQVVVASRWSLQRDERQRPLAILELNNDITDRKRAEAELRESEQRFRDYAEAASDWLWETGPDHSFTRVSEDLTTLGIESASRIGVTRLAFATDVEEEPEKWRLHLATLEAHRPFRHFRYRSTGADGSVVYMVTSGKPMFDADGRFLGYRGVSSDVTAAVRAEQVEKALHQAQAELAHVTRVTTLGEMTASIAHEINQPLGAVVNNASACLRWLAAANQAEARQSAALIIADAHRASEIIGRIRAFVKKAPPQQAWVNINDTIREVLALARSDVHRHRVSLQTHLAEDVPLIVGDRIQLQQVLLNLITNAIEAMSGLSEGPRELQVGSAPAAGQGVRVTVRDSGPGLDPESLDQLFTAFYTTKPHGLGMGLAISRSIIEAHGGRLWATANEGRGAVFQFTLPRGGERVS